MAESAQLARETAGERTFRGRTVRQRLVEHEVWYGLGVGGIEGGSLIQENATTLRTVSGGPRASLTRTESLAGFKNETDSWCWIN